MKIVVTANGANLDAPASPVFGRCSTYIFVDTETMEFEAVPNPAMSAPGGAGIQAAQFVIERDAPAVLTGNVGPNAYNVFQAAGVPTYLLTGGTVREAVEAYKAGRLPSAADASVQAHAGMGMGRGMGRGMGVVQGAYGPAAWGITPPPQPTPPTSRGEEIAALKQTASDLRQQLAKVMERLDKLEKES